MRKEDLNNRISSGSPDQLQEFIKRQRIADGKPLPGTAEDWVSGGIGFVRYRAILMIVRSLDTNPGVTGGPNNG